MAQQQRTLFLWFPYKNVQHWFDCRISQRGFVGLECNYSVVKKSTWMGVYSDVFYDFAQQDTTVTIGPRIGKMVLGVDGGLGVRLGGADQ